MPKHKNNLSASIPQTALTQLNELISEAHYNTKTDALAAAINALYYHKVESANTVTLASRKLAEANAMPELSEHDGKLWLNLGGGLLAEAAAQMLVAQFPDEVEVRSNALDEQLIYHGRASQDAYALLRAIIMFRFD